MTSRKAGAQPRGRPTPESSPSTPAPVATTATTTSPADPKTVDAWTRNFTKTLVGLIVDAGFEAHRLAYLWEDDDTIGEDGKPTVLFVCKCQEAFDRSAYNRHIRDKYKEVN